MESYDFTFVVTGVDCLIGILDVSERHLFTVLVVITSDGNRSEHNGDEDR